MAECRKVRRSIAKAASPRYNAPSFGLVAQLVEQRIENPRVGGSIPPQATKIQAKSPVRKTGLFAFRLPPGAARPIDACLLLH